MVKIVEIPDVRFSFAGHIQSADLWQSKYAVPRDRALDQSQIAVTAVPTPGCRPVHSGEIQCHPRVEQVSLAVHSSQIELDRFSVRIQLGSTDVHCLFIEDEERIVEVVAISVWRIILKHCEGRPRP